MNFKHTNTTCMPLRLILYDQCSCSMTFLIVRVKHYDLRDFSRSFIYWVPRIVFFFKHATHRIAAVTLRLSTNSLGNIKLIITKIDQYLLFILEKPFFKWLNRSRRYIGVATFSVKLLVDNSCLFLRLVAFVRHSAWKK